MCQWRDISGKHQKEPGHQARDTASSVDYVRSPGDRAGTFEPLLVPKRSGRIADGLDDMVISLYATALAAWRYRTDERRPIG
jgi:transposase-like protein